MEIKIDTKLIGPTALESLSSLDKQIKDIIYKHCSFSKGEQLEVRFGSAIVKRKEAKPYILKHNASFSIGYSYVIVEEISRVLKVHFDTSDTLYANITYLVDMTFEKKAHSHSENDKQTEAELSPSFLPIKPKYSFDRIALDKATLNDLQLAVKMVKFRGLIYDTWGYSEIDPAQRCIINMYGPAGTGKTMSAHAIADALGKSILALNYSEIESKYLGEAAKNLAAAFKAASESQSVLFFDEADSFLGKRIQNVTQSSDQALNSLRSQMLILLEQFDGVVIFATNLVSNFDPAFMSRIQKHIKFNLPNSEQRVAIIKKLLPSRLPLSKPFTEDEYATISNAAEGLSGREIKNAIFELLLNKASSNPAIVFAPIDFTSAMETKVKSNELVESEKNRTIKERIIKKMTENIDNIDDRENK